MADALPCFGASLGLANDIKPKDKEIIEDVNKVLDGFSKSMLSALKTKINDQIPFSNKFNVNVITDSPQSIKVNNDKIHKTPLYPASHNGTTDEIYRIPSLDEYYGEIGFFQQLCYFDKFSDGLLSYKFDPSYGSAVESSTNSHVQLTNLRTWFSGVIGPLYGIQRAQLILNKNNQTARMKYKCINEWEDVDIDNIGNKNGILKGLLSNLNGDTHDRWITLIAFTGYGAHRTTVIPQQSEHDNALFKNSTLFLDKYAVRDGYKKYGAAAYFNNKYALTEIELADGKSYKANSNVREWNHAKWCWKVSLSVCIFLVDFISHSLFREQCGLIKALQEALPVDHPIRQLFEAFILGTVFSARCYNEYFRRNGLYHRAFAFQYNSLCELITDSMSSAPTSSSKSRQKGDLMRYRFRLCRKKVAIMKTMPKAVYALHIDVHNHWTETLSFVQHYINTIYGGKHGKQKQKEEDDSTLKADKDLVLFYSKIKEYLNIPQRYRLKKFNLINILTHFICNSTIWNGHLSGAVSFEYSIDSDWTGIKIQEQNSSTNNIQNYVEYCLVVLSKGWRMPNLIKNLTTDEWGDKFKYNQTHRSSLKKIVNNYFNIVMKNLSNTINEENRINRITSYNGCNPKYLQISIMQ